MNTIKKRIYNLLRKYAMRIVTGHLGKVEETDEKLICYVKARKCKQDRFRFTITCKGIGQQTKKIANAYNLNKPICYVIEGVNINSKRVNIFGLDNPEIIIKDCTFAFDLFGHINGKCIIENTFIRSFSSLMFGANELILKNMNIANQLHNSISLDINIGAGDKLEIIDSNVGKIKEKTKVNISSDKTIIIQNSKISGDVVNCKGRKITCDKKSSIESTEKVKIKTEDFDKLKITSPVIYYNGNKIKADKMQIKDVF